MSYKIPPSMAMAVTQEMDFTATGTTNVLLTNSNENFVALGMTVFCSDYTGIVSGSVNISLGFTAPNYDDLTSPSAFNFTQSGQSIALINPFQNPILSVPPSTQLVVNVDIGGTATSFKGKVLVYGYYI